VRPRIVQGEDQIGFHWATPTGAPAALPELVVGDDEPDRLLATHLAALDDALIIAAGRFGELLGGGRRPAGADRDALLELHRALDRLCHEYAAAAAGLGIAPDARAGQIVGTAALLSVRARLPLGLLGPAPFDGELDDPGLGVVGGFGEFHELDPAAPWRGGRWVVRTEDGRRFPLTLSMLLHDSSGVRKDAALVEHRAAVRTVIAALDLPGADPGAAACALDWLLYDWLDAHRDGPDSAAITIPPDREADAAMVVDAAAASVRARATLDPGLAGLLTAPG
jgi:hypothetical protein